MSVKDNFVLSSNIRLLKKIISEHINKKYNIENIFEQKDIQNIFEEQKQITLDSIETLDTVISLNKKMLKNTVPLIYSKVPAQITADDSIKTFYKTEETNENLNGNAMIKFEKQPEKTIIEKDLDICTADRTEYRSPTSKAITPFNFEVNLASSDTNVSISTNETFKNIIGINLTHIIIADSLTNDLYSINKYSHLFIEIEELNGIYSSTSDHGRKALVKVLRDTSWSEGGSSDVRYNLMNTKRTGGNTAVGWYSETPMSSLSKLTINILSPNGYKIKTRRDVFSITSVTENSSSIDFVCESRFEPGAIQIGNRIAFQIISIENVSIGNYLNEGGEFTVESVLNDLNFTVTKQVESFDNSGLPVYQNFSAGTFTTDDYTALNLSMQTSIGLKIKTIEITNDNTFKTNII